MIPLVLFGTQGCHLCELAHAILRELTQQYDLAIIPVDIGDDNVLIDTLGTLIPVVEFSDGSRLNWPFSHHDVEQKLIVLTTICN